MIHKTYLIDLDNCLYDAREQINLVSGLEKRVTSWIKNKLKVDELTAQERKQDLYNSFGGAPLCFVKSGLIRSKSELSECINFINGLPISGMKSDPKLSTSLLNFNNEKYVFTSSPKSYAKQVIKHLGIYDYFDGIIDIFDTEMLFKDNPDIYSILPKLIRKQLYQCVLVEDNEQNLLTAKKAGIGNCVLVTHGKPYVGKFLSIDSVADLPSITSR